MKYILAHPTARQRAHAAIDAAPEGWYVEVKEATRSLEANAALHATLTDVSRQLVYLGKKRSVTFWKGVFVSGWEIATGCKPEIVPGLECEFINIRESTTKMSNKKIASLIEYITAYGSQQGVVWTEPAIEPPEGYR